MMKPRAPSDPPPSTSSEPCGGGNRTFSSTLPARVRDRIAAEPFPMIGASVLLSLDVSHSGWVRKEGYGYRSWKSRFMVLHHGCIYYFKETDSNAPKGKFSLNGYRCLPAPDRERIDRYPYVFKLVPDDEGLRLRTYYISSPSKIEMEGWMNSINIDTRLCCPSEYDYVDTCDVGSKSATCPTVPKKIPMINKRETGYSTISDRAFPHSFPTRQEDRSSFKTICVKDLLTRPDLSDLILLLTYVFSHNTATTTLFASNVFKKPAPQLPPKPGMALAQGEVNYDDQEEFYESVDDSCFSAEEHYVAVLSNETDISFPTGQNIRKPPNVNNGRPVPPGRPKPPPRPPDMQDSESEDEDSEEELYLDLIKAQGRKGIKSPVSPKKNGLSPTSPKRERPIPTPPIPNGPGLSEIDGAPVEVLAEVEQNAPKPLPKPLPRPSPKPPPRMAKTPSQEKKEFDYLPSACYKPETHKNQAKVFLELGRTVGEYMINASQSSDTKMSLSVWLGNGVKHYLIFKRQNKYTLDPSLTRDEHFVDLRQLVKYYHNHPLPKSGKYLKAPFAST